jgi:hypothetical protein
MEFYNLDQVCENCGHTFQAHFYMDCPDGDTMFKPVTKETDE